MEVGFNYPWFGNRASHWIGPFPQVQDKEHLDPLWIRTIPTNFGRLKRMGVSVVRVFLLGDCFNYAPGRVRCIEEASELALRHGYTSPALWSPWRFDQPEYDLDVPNSKDPDGKPRQFKNHYRQLLICAKNSGLRLIPSIVSFEAFCEPNKKLYESDPVNVAGGRRDILIDAVAQRKWITHVLKVFVDLSKESDELKKQIYAIEVMNEPWWNVNVSGAVRKGCIPVPMSMMKTFLSECCKVIEEAGFDSTVGHRFYNDCLEFPTGTIAQFHYYPKFHSSALLLLERSAHLSPTMEGISVLSDIVERTLYPEVRMLPRHPDALFQIQDAQQKVRSDWSSIPNVTSNMGNTPRKVKKVIVGEFGSTLMSEVNSDLFSAPPTASPWPELNGSDRSSDSILHTRLSHLRSLGYELALVWPSLDGDDRDALKMKEDRWASLCRFTLGS